ncbi:MAG: hypothetical protein ACLFQ8_01425 [Candidatus Aenigmatarchaeota archaeon]
MKKVLVFLAVLFLVLPLMSNVTFADGFDENMTVVVEPTLHIDVNITDCTGPEDDTINKRAGETGNCRIEMTNTGNTEYDLDVRGPLEEEPDGWINWNFDCPDLGDCSDEHANSQYHEPPEIREVGLDPGEETHFIMNAMLGMTNDYAKVNIQLKSLDNETEEEEWQNVESIEIETEDERTGDYGPFIAPAYSNLSLVILAVLSLLIFPLTETR